MTEPRTGPTGDPITDFILARREARRQEARRQARLRPPECMRCLPEDLRAIIALALDDVVEPPRPEPGP